jgi:hypothetical protein
LEHQLQQVLELILHLSICIFGLSNQQTEQVQTGENSNAELNRQLLFLLPNFPLHKRAAEINNTSICLLVLDQDGFGKSENLAEQQIRTNAVIPVDQDKDIFQVARLDIFVVNQLLHCQQEQVQANQLCALLHLDIMNDPFGQYLCQLLGLLLVFLLQVLQL